MGLTYTHEPRRSYEKAFDSIGLTTAQRRATDSIMARYACTIDSVYRAASPHVDSIRRQARKDIMEMLNESQIKQLDRALASGDGKHGPRRPDKHLACDHPADSGSFAGHSRFLKL
jgi:hypothetical protein